MAFSITPPGSHMAKLCSGSFFMKTRPPVSSKEMILIGILDEKIQSQRSLASASGFSLGMTNLLLKRLVNKGMIKVVSLKGRTLRYILTPRGFAEKLRRSYEYVILSIRNLNELKSKIQNAIPESGCFQSFCIVGNNELAELAREALRSRGIEAIMIELQELKAFQNDRKTTLLINCELRGLQVSEFKKFSTVHLSSLLSR